MDAKEIGAQIHATEQKLELLRQQYAEAVSPFKVGDVVNWLANGYNFKVQDVSFFQGCPVCEGNDTGNSICISVKRLLKSGGLGKHEELIFGSQLGEWVLSEKIRG